MQEQADIERVDADTSTDKGPIQTVEVKIKWIGEPENRFILVDTNGNDLNGEIHVSGRSKIVWMPYDEEIESIHIDSIQHSDDDERTEWPGKQPEPKGDGSWEAHNFRDSMPPVVGYKRHGFTYTGQLRSSKTPPPPVKGGAQIINQTF